MIKKIMEDEQKKPDGCSGVVAVIMFIIAIVAIILAAQILFS